MAYLLDANVFIEANRRYYGMDFCPAFWDWLVVAHDSRRVDYAHSHGHTVVTQEVPSDGVKRVKIPNVCIGMGVKHMNSFTMLRHERARFVLE